MADVLIVEDNPAEREHLQQAISSAGFVTESTDSVSAAKSLLSEQQFRLALIDVGLSDQSGSHLFEFIRSNDSVPYVIVRTGNPSLHLKQRFLQAGAVAYLVKATPEAAATSVVGLIQSLLGEVSVSAGTKSVLAEKAQGLKLGDFLDRLIGLDSRALFFESDGTLGPCPCCGSTDYVVRFDHQPQIPPEVHGLVVCAECGEKFDREIY